MSLNLTLCCHICGEYYIEREGHDAKQCFENANQALTLAMELVSHWDKRCAEARKRLEA